MSRGLVTDEIVRRGAAKVPPGWAGAYPQETVERCVREILTAALALLLSRESDRES